MSSFEPRGGAAAPAPFRPLSGATPDAGATSRAASVFADLARRRSGARNGSDPGAPAPRAETEADDASARAAERAAAERAAALEAAREEGRAAGRAEVEARYGPVAEGFAAALAELARSRAEMRERYHQELLQIAFEAARKIVHDELSQSREKWLAMIRDAVHRTLDRETIRVRVGPSLHHYLAANLGALRSLLEEVRDLELVEDAGLPPTGCIVETAYGDLDLDPDDQVAALLAAVSGTT